jgi:hypothetical protein
MNKHILKGDIIMAKLLEPKVQATGLLDSFELGILKTLAERTATPIIGNSTLKSGAIKMVAGGVLTGLSKNKHIGLLSSALIIDAVEDMAHTLVGMAMGGNKEAEGGDF